MWSNRRARKRQTHLVSYPGSPSFLSRLHHYELCDLWASYLTSLSLSFLICKMEITLPRTAVKMK